MSADIKLSKVQLSKIIQSGGFLGAFLGKFSSPLMKADVPLAKNVLALLPTVASASAIDVAIQRKILEQDVVTAEKLITLVISDEDDFIRSIKLLENSDVLIDVVSETVTYETKKWKKKESGFLVCY